ncbi:alpha/beta fold hydrolase [Streptomyces sp. NPDC051018]|uniref:alpha/beta fold hydrolase n=1 Tax=Streptomyces sp. NPDC051018 TaxID=3365639 RepID=UPI0037A33833
MAAEYIHRTSYQGFGFACRVVENPRPRTEPIVVLGGAYQNMHSNRRSERPWAAAGTLVNVELPGQGTADALPCEYGFDFMGDALGRLLDELGIPRVNIIAVSYGTAIAYRYTHRNPGRVARLALLGSTPFLTDEVRGAMESISGLLYAGRTAEFARLASQFLACSEPACLRENPNNAAEVLRRVLSAAGTQDTGRFAAANERLLRHPFDHPDGIRGVPTLCVSGEHDLLCPPDQARLLAATVPGAVFAEMKSVGHVMHLERPRDFSDILARFMTDLTLDGHRSLGPLERTPISVDAPGLMAAAVR